MRDTDLVSAITGNTDGSRWRHMRPQVDGSDFPTQWMPSELECSIFDAQVKEIIKLRAQNEQLREAAALVAKESAELLERRWIPVTERLPEADAPVLCWYEYFRYGEYNQMYRTYGIGYCINGRWCGEVSNGRNAKVLAWMPLPEPPEVK